MNDFKLALRQIRYENTAFWRNPMAAFFVFIFPLMFLVIFNLLFGNREMELPGGTTHVSTFYVPAIAALSVIYTCYSNVAVGICFSRDQGLLKRIRGTPLPRWSFLFGRIVHSIFLAVLLVVIVTAAGVLFYNVDIPTNTLPAFLVTLAVGAATFAALGLATTAAVPNADASPAVVNGLVLPLLFISDVFIPLRDAPSGSRPSRTSSPSSASPLQCIRRSTRSRPARASSRSTFWSWSGGWSADCWLRCGSSHGSLNHSYAGVTHRSAYHYEPDRALLSQWGEPEDDKDRQEPWRRRDGMRDMKAILAVFEECSCW